MIWCEFVNGVKGISDIQGKAATGSGERAGKRASFNGAEGISDIEGKAAKGSGERVGKRASFKSENKSMLLQETIQIFRQLSADPFR